MTLDFDKSIIITAETQFQQIDGWSSIMIVQLVVMFDEEFGKDISIEDVKCGATFGAKLIKEMAEEARYDYSLKKGDDN